MTISDNPMSLELRGQTTSIFAIIIPKAKNTTTLTLRHDQRIPHSEFSKYK